MQHPHPVTGDFMPYPTRVEGLDGRVADFAPPCMGVDVSFSKDWTAIMPVPIDTEFARKYQRAQDEMMAKIIGSLGIPKELLYGTGRTST